MVDSHNTRLITAAWLALSAATGVSWYLGTYPSGPHRQWAIVGLMIIAMIKVEVVILYFMEVRAAPAFLKWLCSAWVLAVGAFILGFYLWA
jgi:hypothetical protein